MFENIGGKIKALAKVLCWLGIIASVIYAFVLWSANSRYYSTIGIGFIVLIAGCLASWIGSFFTYAFGEMVENTAKETYLLDRLYEEQKKTNEHLQNLNNAQKASTSTSHTSSTSSSSSPFRLPEL